MAAPSSAADFKVLYAFQYGDDGADPDAGVIEIGGTLYGTTSSGGSAHQGTVFSFDPKTGIEKIVDAFQGGGDGTMPFAGLTNVGGLLYGTTEEGGGVSNRGQGARPLAVGHYVTKKL